MFPLHKRTGRVKFAAVLEEIHRKKNPDHWQESVRILQGAEKDIEGVNCHISNKELLDTKASLSAQCFERKEEKNTSCSNLIPV